MLLVLHSGHFTQSLFASIAENVKVGNDFEFEIVKHYIPSKTLWVCVKRLKHKNNKRVIVKKELLIKFSQYRQKNLLEHRLSCLKLKQHIQFKLTLLAYCPAETRLTFTFYQKLLT
jgi:hypothetical protein